MKHGDLLAAKYRLERVLGSGGMGEVWAAVNETTGRSVAIKLMYSPTPELRVRMLREARAVGTLRHRNIVDIYDVGETGSGDPFLVMERLTGETLADRLERVGRMSSAEAVEITVSIAAALKAAHAKGIVHRDLKPANVFLHREAEGEGEIVKVFDFGVSKLLDEASTITAGPVGSPAYMSPEQADEAKVDARSDLWSLGVVLFQMLAGRRPFTSRCPELPYLVISEIVHGPIPSIADAVPELGPALADVVQRCLIRDVDARVGSAEELIRLLGSSLDTTEELPLRLAPATSATSESTGLDAIPMRRPSRAAVAVIAGAVALSLIVVLAATRSRATPTLEKATAAAGSMEPPDATHAAIAPEVPARTEPATLPSKDDAQAGVDAPAAVAMPADGKPIGTAAPTSAHPRAPARAHPSGEKRLVLP